MPTPACSTSNNMSKRQHGCRHRCHEPEQRHRRWCSSVNVRPTCLGSR
jgi:hypothetical protein